MAGGSVFAGFSNLPGFPMDRGRWDSVCFAGFLFASSVSFAYFCSRVVDAVLSFSQDVAQRKQGRTYCAEAQEGRHGLDKRIS